MNPLTQPVTLWVLTRGARDYLNKILLSSREERIEVRRDLNLFRVLQSSLILRGWLIVQMEFFEIPYCQ